MILLSLLIEGEADKVEAVIAHAMDAIRTKYPDQKMVVRARNSEYVGSAETIKDNTPDSWIKI